MDSVKFAKSAEVSTFRSKTVISSMFAGMAQAGKILKRIANIHAQLATTFGTLTANLEESQYQLRSEGTNENAYVFAVGRFRGYS